MKIKKLLASGLSLAIIAVNAAGFTVSAYSATRTIDNDSIANGYGNENNGFSYITADYLYNGDARIASSSSDSTYKWTYPSVSDGKKSCTCKIQPYLKHSSFTDPAAEYYVHLWQYTSQRVGYINQDTAPSGWSTIISKNFSSVPGVTAYSSSYVEVRTSGRSGKKTGADGIKVSFSS